MGHSANLAIATNGSYELFSNRSCGNELHHYLFWGPHCLEHLIRMLDPVDHTHGWLNNIWAAGSVVFDQERKVLLFFGGEDVMYDLPLRRTYLTMLQRVWRGWEVRWAHGHTTEIADYLGVAVSKVWSDPFDADQGLSLIPIQPDSTDTIVSIAERGKLICFPVESYVCECVDTGPRLLELLRACKSYDNLCLPFTEWCPSALHIDLDGRSVDYCSNRPMANPIDRAKLRWPGWAVRWHRDDVEDFAALWKDAIVYPARDAIDLENRIACNFLRRRPNLLELAALRRDRQAAQEFRRSVLRTALGREPPADSSE